MGNKQNMDKQHVNQNIRLKNFCSQKIISLINNNTMAFFFQNTSFFKQKSAFIQSNSMRTEIF